MRGVGVTDREAAGVTAAAIRWRYSAAMELQVRPAGPQDHAAIWQILEPVIRAGETYALPRDLDQAGALAYWFAPGHETFVAEGDDGVIGTYYLRANQRGGGAHVCNCGYMTSARAAGRGVASAMCTHSLEVARARGFRAMQFNFVVSTNERAVRLWERLGFTIAGRLPGAFAHPQHGFVDALVMYRTL
jgi:ribosomal protein S18 acetylase RimI-like enzyme